MSVIPRETQIGIGLNPIDPSLQLVKQASNGCSDSFGQLVELHHETLRLFLSRFIHCSACVDDIAQEVFLVAYRQLATFRHESKFSTWLLGIARNKALEFLRTEVAQRKSQNQFLNAEIANRKISRLENAKKDFEQTQKRLNRLQSCLDQLPVNSRRLITQHYFDQQPADEATPESRRSCSTIRMKLLRIRRILRKCIMTNSGLYNEE